MKQEIFCVHMADTAEYKWEFDQRTPDLRERFHDWSIARFYGATEPEFRTEAIELNRGPQKWPWGKAIVQAIKTNPHLWSKHENLLVKFERFGKKRAEVQPTSPPPPGLLAIDNGQAQIPAPFKGGGKGKNKDGKGSKDKRVVRTRTGPNGEQLCVRYNDKRGCQSGECKYMHKCDVVLKSSGAACMGKHTAINHDKRRDGEPKVAF